MWKMKRSQYDWEARFKSWGGGPGITEIQKCENAERMIRKAIAAYPALNHLDIEVFAQGSFKNLTNIPQESDVDVSVCLRDAFFFDLPPGVSREHFDLRTPTDLNYVPYRRDVVNALADYFGSDGIEAGNKAIRIHSNSYRVEADVVPNWEHRDYYDVNQPKLYHSGVTFMANDGKWIINYPKQHIDEGILKNAQTGKRFKRLARIMKSLQVEMIEEGLINSRCPSFFLESLVFNVPNNHLNNATVWADVRYILADIYYNTRPTDETEWMEVNNIKYLFHWTQPWTRLQANAFALAAWDYVGFDD
jgi:hypothetical protein